MVQDFCGPNGTSECFLMWNCDWFLPQQCNCALFNAQVVGVFLGQPIFGPPSCGSQSALVRRPDPLDDVRVLDLFAGLGGWEYARDLLSPFIDKMATPMCDTVSVEIDPLCAKVLAANAQRIVLTPDDVTDHVSHEGVVVQGDVRDPSWFGLSVFMPFTDVLWSAPCQPWSLAGNALGFSSDLGLLLAHAIGILVLFKPLRAVGENVAGLHSHPQWERVRHLLHLLPHHVRIQATDLKFLSPMCRKRLFITHQLVVRPEVAPHVDLKPRHWIETGCGFLPRHFLEINVPSEEQLAKFSCCELLPPLERAKAFKERISEGSQVVLRRLAGPLLPTLVASYRNQCELPLENLKAKGLLTWLVSEDRSRFAPRFLDVAEAQRLMGFPFSLILPEEVSDAMHLLGNAVSPIQGAIVLSRVLGCYNLEDLRSAVLHRLYRQPPVGTLDRLKYYGLARLTVQCGVETLPSLDVSTWHLCCDTLLTACVYGCPLDVPKILSLLAIGKTIYIESLNTLLLEDSLAIFVKLKKVCVSLVSDQVVKVCLSPLQSLVGLGRLVQDANADFPGSMCDPLWMFGTYSLQLHLPRPLQLHGEVRFLFGDEVRLWPFVENVCFANAIEKVFPFGISKYAMVDFEGTSLGTSGLPMAGNTYVVSFQPVCYEVAPFGSFWFDPLTTVAQVSDFLSLKYYSGQAKVRIVVNGSIVDTGRKLCFANKLGVMRAKIYCLPGGGPVL